MIADGSIVIDALFGTGLKRPLEGLPHELVNYLNMVIATRIAVDMPSGLLGEDPSNGIIFKAHYTLSFEQPKLAFLFPENHIRVGEWIAKSIGLSKSYYKTEKTTNYFLTHQMVKSYLKKRGKFEHKGRFGHALILAGSKGMMGAAILSASACLRSGSGLTTVYTANCGYNILQMSIPEAMVITDPHDLMVSRTPKNLNKFNAIGIGCGIGTEKETQQALQDLLKDSSQPMVLDADALNIIALNPDMMNAIPSHSILTPHPKEFERLFGPTANQFERNQLQRQKAIDLKCYILLKGAHSCIATPEGNCFFNSTGNPGMATAGSGDVLTGMVTGLLAQGYSSETALCIGVYLHGLAGDMATNALGQTAVIARDIIQYLPEAQMNLAQSKPNTHQL